MFKYKIHHPAAEKYFVINLQGDMLGESLPDTLWEEIISKVDKGDIYAVIDLTNLRFINSSGIGFLIKILTKLRNKGGELILANPSEKLNKLLAMTKLLAIFKIVNSVENANSLLN